MWRAVQFDKQVRSSDTDHRRTRGERHEIVRIVRFDGWQGTHAEQVKALKTLFN